MSKTNEIMQKINEYITKYTNHIPSIGDGFDEIGDMIYNLEKKSEWNNHWYLYNNDYLYKNYHNMIQKEVQHLIKELRIDNVYGELSHKTFAELCFIKKKLDDEISNFIFRSNNVSKW